MASKLVNFFLRNADETAERLLQQIAPKESAYDRYLSSTITKGIRSEARTRYSLGGLRLNISMQPACNLQPEQTTES